MILRRLADAIREQNWFTVIIELVIVVAGILIAVQIDEWNQAQKDRALEKGYLERLLADVENSIERTTNHKFFVKTHADQTSLVLDSLRSCSLDENQRDHFATGLFDLGKMVPSIFVLGSMNEMLSTGKFSVIQSAKVRTLMNELVEEAEYQERVFPLILDSASREVSLVHANTVFLLGEYRGDDSGVVWNEIDIDFNALCDDLAVQAAISTVRAKDYENIDFLDRALTKLTEVRIALRAELDPAPQTIHGETE